MSNVYDNMSNAELEVCNFFKELKIFWTYEQPVFLSDDGNNVSAGIERILQVYNFVIKSFTYSHK